MKIMCLGWAARLESIKTNTSASGESWSTPTLLLSTQPPMDRPLRLFTHQPLTQPQLSVTPGAPTNDERGEGHTQGLEQGRGQRGARVQSPGW